MKNTSVQEELRELSPLLLKEKEKKDSLKVPEGYFEGLYDPEQPYFSEITQLSGTSRKPVRMWLKPLLWSAAAALALLITAFYFMQPNQESMPITAHFEPLTPESATAYVEENILEFEPELLENYTETTLLVATPAEETATAEELDVSEEQVLDALTEEELRDLL